MTDSTQEVSSSPGRILRAAREELGYSVGYVADSLHLRSSVVESIESEDFEGFTSDVFLKGYFRSYCRLVNLHEERMVELLDQQLGQRKKQKKAIDKEAAEAKKARRNSKLLVLAAMVLFFCAIGYLVFTSLSEQQEREALSETVSAPESITPVAPATEAKAEDKPHTPHESVDEQFQSDAKSEALEPAPAEASTRETEQSTSSVGESNAQVDSAPQGADEESSVPVAAQTSELQSLVETEPTQLEDGLFSAEFMGDCWFTLKNGEGKTVYASLKREGDKISYSGALPFNIVFGNANVVSASFNEQAVDLKPFTRRNGRAELNLGEPE